MSTKPYFVVNSKSKNDRLVAIQTDGESKGDMIYISDQKPKPKALSERDYQKIDEIIGDKILKNFNKHAERIDAIKIIRLMVRCKKSNVDDDRFNDCYREVMEEFDNQYRDREIYKPDGKFQILPDMNGRQVMYIAAPSGSGKSYWIKNYCRQYNKMFPDRTIYLFSKIYDDESMDDLENVVQVELDDEYLEDPYTIDDLEDCMVIFDDVDTISDRDLKKSLNDLKSDIMELGRHNNISFCCSSHLINKGAETKSILNESHFITVFPNSNYYAINYVMSKYLGWGKKQIEKLKTLGRAVTINKNYPNFVQHEKGLYFI